MKVFTSGDIKLLEKCAVDSGVTMEQLMEKAGGAVAAYIKKQWEIKDKNIIILCGKGNNGGDGFVCGRKLSKLGAKVTVVLVQNGVVSELAKSAFEKLPTDVVVSKWDENKFAVESLLESADFIVDAMFGFSFKGKIEGSLVRLVEFSNKCTSIKIAVDLPSGAECDTGKVDGPCFAADYTIAFTAVKPANVLNPATSFCGKNIVAPVGIDKSMVDAFPSSFTVLKDNNVRDMLLPRPAQSNKGDFGRLLMICGSYGMIGACIMAARGALRSGLGLLNIAVTKDIYPLIATAVPEAVFTVLDFSGEESSKASGELLFDALKKATACLIGCGLGAEAPRYVSTVIKFAECPIILDADGINYIAENIDELAHARSSVILTPHPGEMARLVDKTIYAVQRDRFTVAKSFSGDHGVYTVLKGAGTLITSPEGEVRINVNGNSGMAKGGSGDVLAGIIGAWAAQGMAPMDACSVGVFIHGKAGDICAQRLSEISMLPTDLIEALPAAYLTLA